MNKMNPEISFETDNSKLGFCGILNFKAKASQPDSSLVLLNIIYNIATTAM